MSYNRRTLSPDSPFAILAALLFFAAAAVRTVGFILSYSGEFLLFDLVLELIVPALCCVIFGAMLLSRKKSLIPTVFPIVGGSLYNFPCRRSRALADRCGRGDLRGFHPRLHPDRDGYPQHPPCADAFLRWCLGALRGPRIELDPQPKLGSRNPFDHIRPRRRIL